MRPRDISMLQELPPQRSKIANPAEMGTFRTGEDRSTNQG
jgi:hypothetical protein